MSYSPHDFVEDRTHDGRKLRMRQPSSTSSPKERLTIRIDRKLKSTDVIDVLSDLFSPPGLSPFGMIHRIIPSSATTPAKACAACRDMSDNGPEFIARAVRERIAAVGARTAFIEPGSPWENGYRESFKSKLRDELLTGELFYSLAEAWIVIDELAPALQYPAPALDPRPQAARAGRRALAETPGHFSRGR